MSRALRRRLHGNGRVALWAVGFVLLGIVLVYWTLNSSRWWNGTSVQGVDRGGVVYYTYDNVTYSLDKQSQWYDNRVYFDPAHPVSSAQLGDTYGQAAEIGLMAAPFIVAAAILALGLRRRRPISELAWPSGSTASPKSHLPV